MINRYLTVPEICRRTGLGRRQIARAIRSGELPTYSFGSWPRVRTEDLHEWLDGRRRLPARETQQSGADRA